MNILITYVYYETSNSLINLKFFIKNGVFPNDNVTYNFIIKGGNCSVQFPVYDNINIYKTNNEGYDFGGYSYSINTINKDNFDYFIFLNDTVIGPFVPRYTQKSEWYTQFVSLLSKKVKLVGSTINRKMYNHIPKHVQSMAFATDRVGLQLLIYNDIFNLDNNIQTIQQDGKWGIILKFEIGMSGIIMNNGFEIDSFLQLENNQTEIWHGDIHYNNSYFNDTINPIEVMFIKKNRVNTTTLQNYITWNT
tara:strand:- start:928 stop:1674 length:747 start_codon:yes stop_codon:yes gene_type:complete